MWSSSAVSNGSDYAWYTYLDDGTQDYNPRYNTGNGVVCVR
jgi:hypothetical protein